MADDNEPNDVDTETQRGSEAGNETQRGTETQSCITLVLGGHIINDVINVLSNGTSSPGTSVSYVTAPLSVNEKQEGGAVNDRQIFFIC